MGHKPLEPSYGWFVAASCSMRADGHAVNGRYRCLMLGSTGKRRAGGAARLGMRRTNRSFLVKRVSLLQALLVRLSRISIVSIRTSPPPTVFLTDGWSQSWPLIFRHRMSGVYHYSLDASWLVGSPRGLPYARPVRTSSRLEFQLRSIFGAPRHPPITPTRGTGPHTSIERPGCLR